MTTNRALSTGLFAVFACFLGFSASARADERPAPVGATGQTTPFGPSTPVAHVTRVAPIASAVPSAPSALVAFTSDQPGARLVRFDFLGSGGGHLGYYDLAPICTAPCTADLDASSSFRVLGPGLTPSPIFQVPQLTGPGRSGVQLDVHAGSWGRSVAGIVLTALGSAYVPVGAGLLGGQAAFGDERSRALVPLGATFLGVGALCLAVGLPLWLGNQTHVTMREY